MTVLSIEVSKKLLSVTNLLRVFGKVKAFLTYFCDKNESLYDEKFSW